MLLPLTHAATKSPAAPTAREGAEPPAVEREEDVVQLLPKGFVAALTILFLIIKLGKRTSPSKT